ncbi:MAG: flagellar basal body rod protein FlgB [Bacillota bacterium]|nr:flagellar basal body rod protein FlgB [Bacillota bacterium]
MAGGVLGVQADLALERALDGSVLRHQAIAENLANVDTPRYKRLEVEFAAALKAALAKQGTGVPLTRTDPRHLPGGQAPLAEAQPSVWRVLETTGRADRNNVDLDAEMVKLAENTLLYNSLTQVLGRRLAMQRFVINEGRR